MRSYNNIAAGQTGLNTTNTIAAGQTGLNTTNTIAAGQTGLSSTDIEAIPTGLRFTSTIAAVQTGRTTNNTIAAGRRGTNCWPPGLHLHQLLLLGLAIGARHARRPWRIACCHASRTTFTIHNTAKLLR